MGSRKLWIMVIAATVGIVAVVWWPGQEPTESGESEERRAPESVEDEVRGNVTSQLLGVGQSVADLELGDELLASIADRIIQDSFHQRRLQLQSMIPPPEFGVTEKPADPARAAATTLATMALPEVSAETRAHREAVSDGRPSVRGFRADTRPWPSEDPQAGSTGKDLGAAQVIARDLASEGLLRTLVEAVSRLGPAEVEGSPTRSLETLKKLGFPVDWLPYFAPDGDAAALLRNVARELASGEKTSTVKQRWAGTEMRFVPSAPGFRAADESGGAPAAAVRVQLSRGDSWGGLEDGGAVEVMGRVAAALPDATVFAHIEPRFLDVLRESAAGLPTGVRDRIRVVLSSGPVSQWAQDNGKAGSCVDEAGNRAAATLLPRYASFGQDGSTFIPGDTYLFDALRAAGHRVYQSPLLFQGGDILVVRHPGHGERWAFLGEGEIARNRALGLNRQQTLAAFAAELGVERCVVLPSISFHIDYDVTFRAVGDELIAFVEDTDEACRLVLGQALKVFREMDILNTEAEAELRRLLEGSKTDEALRDPFLRTFSQIVAAAADPRGAFPVGFIHQFSNRDIHRALGNFQRVLAALDQFAAGTLSSAAMSGRGHQMAHLRAYRRQGELRSRLADQLRSLNIRVVAVPSFSDGPRSITTVNGVQVPGAYLMPTYSGKIAEAVDLAAKAAFRSTLGAGVRVIEIPCAESQRRNGAVHCSVAVYPEPVVTP